MPKLSLLLALAGPPICALGASQEVPVAGQPLAENVRRVLQALELLGSPLPPEAAAELRGAVETRDSALLQRLLDPRVLLIVEINPEMRVKVRRGPARALL